MNEERDKKYSRANRPVIYAVIMAFILLTSVTLAVPLNIANANEGPLYPQSSAQYQLLKDQLGKLVDKPYVQDQDLKNAFKELYKAIDKPNKVGDGTTAVVVAEELKTGELVKGKDHVKKAIERIKNLKNVLEKKFRELHPTDVKRAKDEIQKLEDALKTPKGQGGFASLKLFGAIINTYFTYFAAKEFGHDVANGNLANSVASGSATASGLLGLASLVGGASLPTLPVLGAGTGGVALGIPVFKAGP